MNPSLIARLRTYKLRKMQATPGEEFYHLKKRGYYYRAAYKGYTAFISEAGVYSKKEAVSHALHCSDVDLEKANPYIKYHPPFTMTAEEFISKNSKPEK